MNTVSAPRVFQPPTLSGLRVTNLPPWTTDETFYKDLVKLKIITDSKEQSSNMSSFKVRGHKRYPEALGDCFLYFKSDEAAQDAMNKLIGYEISKGYTLNCSQLVSKEDLRLKNSKNVCFEKLKENVTLREFYEALIKKTDGILSLLIQQVNGYNYGFALFKSVEKAKAAASGITIGEKVYYGKETNPDKAATKSKPLFGTDLIQGNNVLITFDQPLTDAEPSEYIKAITELFKDSIISSAFVWGKDARHMVHGSTRIQELNPAISEIPRCELRDEGEIKPEFANPNQNSFNKNFYDCYRFQSTKCPKLLQNQKKAYVSFASKQQAVDFINKFHSSGSDFLFNVAGKQYVIEDCEPYNPIASKQKAIRELKHKIKPTNVLFLKNLKNSINEDNIKQIFSTQGYDISSVKIKSPESDTLLNDKKLEQQTKFATILVNDTKVAQDLVEKFKKDSSFRSKFQDIFEDYRYISMLQHKSQIKKTLKEKNPQRRSQSTKTTTQNSNQHIANFLPFPPFTPGLNPTMFLPNQFRPIRNNFTGGHIPRNFSANANQQGQSAPNANAVANNANNTQNVRPQFFNQSRQYNPASKERGYNNYQNANQGKNQNYRQRSYEANKGYKGNYKNQTGPKVTPQGKPTAPKGPAIAPKQPPTNKPLIQPTQPPAQQTQQVPAVKTSITLNDVQNLTKEEQKKILGTHMYNRVIKILPKEEVNNAPKITGMLIDFEVFSLEEILELINNEEDLDDQVKDALELIKESTQQTAN